MAKAKRPRKKPDVSKPPKLAQMSWQDRRPPGRGKRAGTPTKPRQEAKPANPVPIGTSVSGKPNRPSDLSTIPSSPAKSHKSARGRGSKGPREKKPKPPKKASYELIEESSPVGRTAYEMLKALIRAYHRHLMDATIALAFNRTWKPDSDGHVTLGKCKKATDLDRELAPYDFVILLRQDFWNDRNVSDDQRRALLDHELCHAGVKRGPTGEQLLDEKGRVIYRTLKHDIQEFSAIVLRYGVYTRDLEQFYAALKASKQQKLPFLQPQMPAPGKAAGEAPETIGGGEKAMSPGATDEVLRKIAGGGNGKELHDDLPPGAPPLADDLDRAAARDLAASAPPA